MATQKITQIKLQALKAEFDTLRQGKESLLAMIDDAEIPESVYNSNAIENSTLTLKETEKILLDMEVSRVVSLREVYEAKNLARVIGYIRGKAQEIELNQETILLLHQMLIGGIKDEIAGRFRKKGEYVRVGSYIAPAPEQIEGMLNELMTKYSSDLTSFVIDKIAAFHLGLETIHPFNDGDGRIGRVLMNAQLLKQGFPVIIIRDKEKQAYYTAFDGLRFKQSAKKMEKVVTLALTESLHKRVTYFKGDKVVTLADYTKRHKSSAVSLLNAARRQSIPAFREKGVWKIGSSWVPNFTKDELNHTKKLQSS